MHILLAPDAFKGSMTAAQAARAMANGLPDTHTLDLCPLADGGEGTLDVLLSALGGTPHCHTVCDPLGRSIEVSWALLSDGTALIESARVLGLPLLKAHERDPEHASSSGLGELVLHILKTHAPHTILIALGGSATVDGGVGLLGALGARFFDTEGGLLPHDKGLPYPLHRVSLEDLEPRLTRTCLVVLNDVKSPLLGPRGAQLYMPQKGATPEVCERLQARLVSLVRATPGGSVAADLPGAGAAGGLGFALSLCGAESRSGSGYILKALGVQERIERADLVLTGEGRLDGQTAEGKLIASLAEMTRAAEKPIVVLCGAHEITSEQLDALGITAVFSIVDGPCSVEEAMARGPQFLEQRTAQIARIFFRNRIPASE